VSLMSFSVLIMIAHLAVDMGAIFENSKIDSKKVHELDAMSKKVRELDAMLHGYDVLIVGAGLSGGVIAERHTARGDRVLVMDKRTHIGGNCYDYVEGSYIFHKSFPHLYHSEACHKQAIPAYALTSTARTYSTRT
jgi:monoamine oxidase